MKIIVITGPPYCGKGTQCEILERDLQYKHISTGERIRLEKQQQTETGILMSTYAEKGNLVPDAVMKTLLGTIIDECAGEPGIILDGYPRTKDQVDTLLELLAEKGQAISLIINIEVPQDELMRRAGHRAATSDREDDKDPAIHFKRIAVFETATRPAIDYMKQLLPVHTLEQPGTIDEIAAQIKTHIQAHL